MSWEIPDENNKLLQNQGNRISISVAYNVLLLLINNQGVMFDFLL